MIISKFNSLTYKKIVKPILFKFDAEKVHNAFIKIGKVLGSNEITKLLTKTLYNYQNKLLEQRILDINFRNPVGLAAGFDKNAELVSIMEDVGFGFAEVGAITALPHQGNPGKRMQRLIPQKSLWIYLGLNNQGAKLISQKLKNKKFKIPYGINIAKTNCKETTFPKIGLQDYITSLKLLHNLPAYLTLNISCPNAFGGQDFASPKLYESLLKEVDKLNLSQPVFVKISPDTTKSDLDKIISISHKHKVNGFILTNLSKKHKFNSGKGGLSGKPAEKRSNELIKYFYKKLKSKTNKKTKSRYIIIGVGGIFSAENAYKKIKLGANLVQLITGMIFEGPGLIGDINCGLVRLLKKDGYKNISEAVGQDVK